MFKGNRVAALGIAVALATTISADLYFDFGGEIITTEKKWIPGPVVKGYNDTNRRFQVIGWRFLTKDVAWTKVEGDSAKYYSTKDTDEGILHEGRLSRPDLYLIGPKGSEPAFELTYGGLTVDANLDGTPTNSSVLLKLSAKGVMDTVIDTMSPIKPSEVSSYISSFDTYYDSEYRYLDTLGMRGGPSSGGFLDTWNGETQIQMAVPKDTFTLSNTPVWLAPETAEGPNYWMALAMLQEYFHADMQFQMTIGFKETMAGLASVTDPNPYIDGNKKNNNDGAFGPFEVEKFTFVSQAIYYPPFYPKYKDRLTNAKSEGDFDAQAFTLEYNGPIEGTYLKQPYIIGCMIGSHFVFRRIYDLLMNAETLCFKEMVLNGKDHYFARAALGVLYNRGITAPGANTFGDTTLVDTVLHVEKIGHYLDSLSANEYIPMGNSEYRHHLLENFHRLEEYSKQAVADKSVPIYDEWITLKHIEEFFFGENGSASSQGEGGLCVHFEVDRQQLWSDLQQAFNALEGHWSQSPKAISYRYDWLTLLRAVKAHFPVSFLPRPTNGESSLWLGKREIDEGDAGCDGTPVDKTAPMISRKGSELIGSDFRGQYYLSDNQDIEQLIWTTDYKWDTWHNGVYKKTEEGRQIWQLDITDGSVEEGKNIWVGAVDASGNAEVRKFTIENYGDVGVLKNGSQNHAISAHIFSNRVRLTGKTDEAVTLSLFDLKGRMIRQENLGKLTGGSVSFSMRNIAAGAYVLRLQSGTIQSAVKLSVQ